MSEKTRTKEEEEDKEEEKPKRIKEYNKDEQEEKTDEEFYDEEYDTKCPECESTDLEFDESRGEVSCRECDSVFKEDKIDRGPEWRAFNSQEMQDKSRVGAPTTKTMHDKGLTTKIDWKDRDSGGRSLSPQKRNQMKRLRKRNKRSKTKDPKDKNLQFALSEIDRMCNGLGLPENVKEISSAIYRRALDEDLIRGRSIESVAASAIYIAAKERNIPRSLDEVTKVSRIEEKKIGRAKRHISRELDLKVEPSDPKNYVPRFCSNLGLSKKVENMANELIDEAVDKGLLSGKSPTGFAAAAIYTASLMNNEDKTQREVAEEAGVTEVTIRNHCNDSFKNFLSKGTEEDETEDDEPENEIDLDSL